MLVKYGTFSIIYLSSLNCLRRPSAVKGNRNSFDIGKTLLRYWWDVEHNVWINR